MVTLPLESPTDRICWPPHSREGVGVDTVRIRALAASSTLNELRYQYFTQTDDPLTGERLDWRNGCSGWHPVGLTAARVTGRRTGGLETVSIELSLPSMLHGQNRDPLPREQLAAALEVTLSELSQHLPDLPSIDRFGVQRLDLVRDFETLGPPTGVMRALRGRVVPRASIQIDWLRPDGSMQLQTIERGSASQWRMRGYDKGYELGRKAQSTNDPTLSSHLRAWAAVTQDRLRFEVQLRQPVLQKRGLTMVKDCAPERLNQVARQYFEHVGWATPYGGNRVQDILDKLQAELTRSEFNNLLLYLYAVEHDRRPTIGRNQLERVRPIARKYALLDDRPDTPCRRLDFDSGHEELG